jgi:hypothetical protein
MCTHFSMENLITGGAGVHFLFFFFGAVLYPAFLLQLSADVNRNFSCIASFSWHGETGCRRHRTTDLSYVFWLM